jgi:acyl carrier protein
MSADYISRINRAIREATHGELPAELSEGHSFVFDLGFDSLAMARLGLTLEDQFGVPILLDSWMSSQSDPSALTVGSLRAFVESRLEVDERAAP